MASDTYTIIFLQLTLKNSLVEPPSSVPYWIEDCLTKSSADSMGETIRSTVKKAAKLAVYELIKISVKNHHTLATNRPEQDLEIKEFF